MKYQHQRVISSDELELPDDPETTRMATAVVLFCIFAGPTAITLIMLTVIHAEAIDQFFKDVVLFLYRHPFVTFTLSLYALGGVAYLGYRKAKKFLL